MLFLCAHGAPGCMPSYRTEGPVLAASPPPSAAEHCYQGQRMELSAGSAEWTKTTGGYGLGYVFHESFSATGIAPHQAGEQLEPETALEILDDPQLTRAYRDRLDESAGDATMYPIWMTSAFGLALGGLAVTSAALPLVLDDPESDKVMPLALGGAGIALLALIPTIGAWLSYDGAVTYSRFSTLFSDGALAKRLEGATIRYNHRVAKRCNYDGPVDAPMSPTARRMVGP